jgi:hypothetical protein
VEKANRYSVEYEWANVVFYQEVEAMTIQEAKERVQHAKVNAAIRAVHVIEDVES